mmetsp:Transcript_11207/g.22050  ORF Transcript_11207/g.22050 Transcript_11207/m.22050 type:complete len:206 (-) Transcript_11207:34-651(-)
MHPHDNPKYKEEIILTFLRCYSDKSLVLEPSPEETQFQNEVKLEGRRVMGYNLLGVVGVWILDTKYFIPKWGLVSWPRFGSIFCCGFMIVQSSWALGQSRNKWELVKSLSWKYERQLLELDPELRLFYLPTPNFSIDPTRASSGSDYRPTTDISRESSLSQGSSYLQPGQEEFSSEGSAYAPPPNVKDWSKSDWRGDNFRPGRRE